MRLRSILLASALVGAISAGAATSAMATTYTFIGSWNPDDARGPVWSGTPPNGPLAYTGQEAAAFLFGGNASDYVISTVNDQVADINFSAVYDVIGYGGATFAQNYVSKYLGQYYGPTSGYTGDITGAASALVRDNGVAGTNFAFRADNGGVPEPASWALMISGFGLAGATLRRRRTVAA